MFGLFPFRFRFRGRVRRLLQLYACFVENPDKGLHPTQIARHTGIGFTDVARYLDATPELFVRLPGRGDGVTRYRLVSAMAAQDPDMVEQYVMRQARRESWLLYAIGAMVLLTLLIIAILIAPSV